jgi:hypothetical protein
LNGQIDRDADQRRKPNPEGHLSPLHEEGTPGDRRH